MYKPPVCECGAPLYYWEEVMHEVITPITQNGFLSKRKVTDNQTESGAWPRLKCKECFQEYAYKEDDNGRIIRTAEWK